MSGKHGLHRHVQIREGGGAKHLASAMLDGNLRVETEVEASVAEILEHERE